jgi:chaperone modulatory protein CbpM
MLDETELVRRVAGMTVVQLHAWVEWGWVRPVIRDEGVRFTDADAARAALIHDLHDTLGLDVETVPVVLKLIDQVHGLRRQLKTLVEAIEQQPDDVRTSVRAHVEQRFTQWREDKTIS